MPGSDSARLEPDYNPIGSDEFVWRESISNSASSAGLPRDETPFRARSLQSSRGRQSPALAPIPARRAHKKSRAGCYMCKSRKVKCGEQKPKCGNCMFKGLSCVYPAVEQPRRRDVPLTLAKRLPSSMSPGTSSFTITDMRFFHHFLTLAYPHLPLGNDRVWLNEIPQFAENQEYLMHAMLSLGASHLSRLTGIDYRKQSLVHRGHAITGLNQALNQKARSFGESDALLATCYALTFQASYMGDGLADFITMVRGCALTSEKIKDERAPTAFNLQPDFFFKVMATRLSSLPRVSAILLEDAFLALSNLRPFLATDTDHDFHKALVDVVVSSLASSQSGYLHFIEVFTVWCDQSHDSFKSFLDADNMIAQLLLAYFVAVQLLLLPLAAQVFPGPAHAGKEKLVYSMIEWAHGLFNRLENSFSQYLDWPKRIIATVESELDGAIPDGPPVLQLTRRLTQAEILPSGPLPYALLEEAPNHMTSRKTKDSMTANTTL